MVVMLSNFKDFCSSFNISPRQTTDGEAYLTSNFTAYTFIYPINSKIFDCWRDLTNSEYTKNYSLLKEYIKNNESL